MTTTTEYTKAQLATVLSALDDRPRNPANREAALEAIGRSAERLGLTRDDVLAAAPVLLDGRLSPAEFRVELHDLAGTEPQDEAPFVEVRDAPQAAPEAQEPAPADQGAALPSSPRLSLPRRPRRTSPRRRGLHPMRRSRSRQPPRTRKPRHRNPRPPTPIRPHRAPRAPAPSRRR